MSPEGMRSFVAKLKMKMENDETAGDEKLRLGATAFGQKTFGRQTFGQKIKCYTDICYTDI
jgi:hypothetical protein